MFFTGYGTCCNSAYTNCESSLTAVANKSLDLSRSLTDKCVQLAGANVGNRRNDPMNQNADINGSENNELPLELFQK